MTNAELLKLPFLFVQPRRYFAETISNNSLIIKDLIFTGLFVLIPLVALNLVESNSVSAYENTKEMAVYSIGTVTGYVVSILFRTYFLTLSLQKLGFQAGYKKVGMVVILALIANLVFTILAILVNHSELSPYLGIARITYNLLLILLGIVSSTKVDMKRGLGLVLAMLAIEWLFIFLLNSVQ